LLKRGHGLSIAAPPEMVDPKDTAFERYLVSRIEGATAQTWLDKLPFHVAALTTEAFGLLLTNGPKARILIRDAARKCRCSLWQALALIIEHKILITKPARKAKGIDALRVNPKHIDKALDRAAQQITSFREAAQALETDAQTICAMAKKGILERQREQERRPNQRHRAVYTKSLQECIAKYGDAKTALFELKSSVSD